MANPTLERAALTRLLNTPNLSVLIVRVVIQGQVQIEAIGPGSLDRVKVLLLPDSPSNLIDFAPASWWLNSTTLFSAVDNGFIDVESETPTVQGQSFALGPNFIPAPSSPRVGDLLVFTGVGWDSLPAGPDGYVLTSNGPDIVPTYQPGGSGGGGGSGESQIVTLNCDPSVAVRDVVYIVAPNTVAKATASGSDHAVGIVHDKPTPTTASVVLSGKTLPVFFGLTSGAEYYLSTVGGLTTTPPSVVGTFVQMIGTAQNPTTLLVNVGPATPNAAPEYANLEVPMATDRSTDSSVYLLIGGMTLDASDYDQVSFVTLAAVSNTILTGRISLYNLTDEVEVTFHEYSGVPSPTEVVTTLGLPAGPKVYEVRQKVDGGSTIGDRIVTNWAGFRLSKRVE